jgi:hypothetical protein
MKMKYDFVTNSSTTSFVMYGFITSNKEVEKSLTDQMINDLNIFIADGIENGAPNDDQTLVGVILGERSSDEYGECEIQDINLQKVVEDMKYVASCFDLTFDDLKIITGTRMS